MKHAFILVSTLLLLGWSTHVGAQERVETCPYVGGVVRHDHSCFHQTLMGALAQRRALSSPWHAYYYDPAWGMPVAVVVPPRAKAQTVWGWGVGNTRVIGIPHQFQPGYPAVGIYDRSLFRPTPAWPTDTTQFGYYYIRGPW